MHSVFPYVFYVLAFAGGVGLVVLSIVTMVWRNRVIYVLEPLLSLIFGALVALDYGVRLLGVRVPGGFHAVIGVAVFVDSLALIAIYLRRGRMRAREAVEEAR